jgi:hypothetical protein
MMKQESTQEIIDEGADAWIARPDIARVQLTWPQIDPSRVSTVLPERIEEAKEMLERESILELRNEELLHFTGLNFSFSKGNKPYLVRGVSVADARGRSLVYELDKTLWIRYECLHKKPIRIVKYPLIVILQSRPDEILVDGLIVY